MVALGSRHKKVLLPLLDVLKSVKPEQRVILLAHLDDKTRDLLYQTIQRVLTSDRVPFRKRLFLKSKLSDHKHDLRFLADRRKSVGAKKRKLAQMGAGPMSYILKAAIPLLLNVFTK